MNEELEPPAPEQNVAETKELDYGLHIQGRALLDSVYTCSITLFSPDGKKSATLTVDNNGVLHIQTFNPIDRKVAVVIDSSGEGQVPEERSTASPALRFQGA